MQKVKQHATTLNFHPPISQFNCHRVTAASQ